MEPVKHRFTNPEQKVRDRIRAMLERKGWYVEIMHGNLFQSGIPDLFATHKRYGYRWVEVKLPKFKGSRYTAAQLKKFPILCANGSGVWVLTEDTEEEYNKLFEKYNWESYAKNRDVH